MEIQSNDITRSPGPAGGGRIPPRQQVTAAERISFEGAAAVERALARTPDVRQEVIEHAKRLVGDPTYPPPETIRRLSQLLAMRLP
jgi:hypothetical protein